MSMVVSREKIEVVLKGVDVVAAMEEAFAAYSDRLCVIPPVGELIFKDPPGEMHIKYGYITGGEHYVVKIASGFYNNPALGLSSSQGVMLLFSCRTGELKGVLLDEGLLTNVRTAAAGAVAAKYLAPGNIEGIGIIGGGIQARLQLEYLKDIVECRKVWLWCLNSSEADSYIYDFRGSGFDITPLDSIEELCHRSQIIVSTTPSTEPLIKSEYIRSGTHITAVGSDTAEKIELEPELFRRVRWAAVDSIEQSLSRGEIFRAGQAGVDLLGTVCELGNLVNGQVKVRACADEITVADLTGIAVQDLKISEAVLNMIRSN